jgi:hypothetical protein
MPTVTSSVGKGWTLTVAGNAAIGVLVGLGWPFVYLMGYAIADRAEWIVGDPTVTDDGAGLPIFLGALVLLMMAGLFAALNWALRGRGRLPVAIAVSVITGAVVAVMAHPY